MTVQNQFKPIRPAELLAALTIFLLPTIAYLIVAIVGIENMDELPQWLDILLKFFFVGSCIAAFGFAIWRGLPRWSPPYLGILIVSVLFLGPFGPIQRLWEWAFTHMYRGSGLMRNWSMIDHVLYQGVLNAILWSLVLFTAVVLIMLLRLFPFTRALWQRVRADWTQLSFLVYGGIVIYFLFLFDEYQEKELWAFAALIFLAIGCLFYLYAREKNYRILILLGGATLAMWIVVVGKWYLVPIQDWGTYSITHPPETERWFEFYRTVAQWVCIVIALLSPALLRFLPTIPPGIVKEQGGSV